MYSIPCKAKFEEKGKVKKRKKWQEKRSKMIPSLYSLVVISSVLLLVGLSNVSDKPTIQAEDKGGRACKRKKLYIHVHRSIPHSSQKVEATPVSTDRWMDKQMWSIHTMKYSSALEGNSDNATTWVNLWAIRLSEISHSLKDKYCMIPLICST